MLTIGAFLSTFALQGSTATDVVNRSFDLLAKADTIVGVYTDTSVLGIATADFHLKKGSKLALIGKSLSEYSNGVDRATVDHKKKTYTVRDVRMYGIPYMVGLEGFTMNGKEPIAKPATVTDQKFDTFDGKQVASYRVRGATVYVDPSSLLPVGAVDGDGRQRHTYRFKNLKVNAPVSDSTFDFSGNGYTKLEVREEGMAVKGSTVNLEDTEIGKLATGKRAVVVLFFSDQSSLSSDALSKFVAMSKRTPKDVQLVAVPQSEGWQKKFKGKLGFPHFENGFGSSSYSARFGVTKYPSVFVLDSDGKVLHSQVGARPDQLDPVLIGLGISRP